MLNKSVHNWKKKSYFNAKPLNVSHHREFRKCQFTVPLDLLHFFSQFLPFTLYIKANSHCTDKHRPMPTADPSTVCHFSDIPRPDSTCSNGKIKWWPTDGDKGTEPTKPKERVNWPWGNWPLTNEQVFSVGFLQTFTVKITIIFYSVCYGFEH